jgi:hypothetical protein
MVNLQWPHVGRETAMHEPTIESENKLGQTVYIALFRKPANDAVRYD